MSDPTLDDPGTESPIHDALAIERLREGLARWGCDE